MTRINSGNFWIPILLILLILISGCGETKKERTQEMEVELFAKAQELQKKEKFLDAIETYRKIISEYPETRQGANSQFMIGYIFANHVKDFEQAKIELDRFLEKYSTIADSGLVAGAKFELQFMGKDIDDIPILSDLGEESKEPASEEGDNK